MSEFLTVAVIHFLAVASPGPDFAIMLKQSVSYGRKAALWSSVGIGLGIFVHVAYSVLGLGLIISQSIIAFTIVKYLGASYLFYIGICALRASPDTKIEDNTASMIAPTSFKSFSMGFVTNALNPKATLFFLAVFSVTVSPQTPAIMKIAYGVWMAFATTVWFSSLSLLFSKQRVREFFKKSGYWFERSMGAILVALGVKLALTTAK